MSEPMNNLQKIVRKAFLLPLLYLASHSSLVPLYSHLFAVHGGGCDEVWCAERRLVRSEASGSLSSVGWQRLRPCAVSESELARLNESDDALNDLIFIVAIVPFFQVVTYRLGYHLPEVGRERAAVHLYHLIRGVSGLPIH